ncbi:MAG: pirin family protein [Acidobacteriota bacterium]
MSVTDASAMETVECQSAQSLAPVIESLQGREVQLGSIPVTRTLPLKQRRMVGPWCFVDRFGPMTFTEGHPMDVAPHPHTGLQTVTWLLDGEIRHDDSLGCATVTHPGGVSVMTAGRGIAHAEQTPEENSHRLDGVQLWVALPDAARHIEPAFSAIEQVPVVEPAGGLVRVFAGSAMGVTSAAPHHSAIVGIDIELHPGASVEIPLEPMWEHAAIVLRGDAALEGRALDGHQLHYLGTHRHSAAFTSREGARLLVLGGPPFPEKILMWWNFVARTPEELTEAREDWMAHRRFGDVQAYNGPRLDAPGLTGYRPRVAK